MNQTLRLKISALRVYASIVILIVLSMPLLTFGHSNAADLARPTEKIVLRISGNIEHTNVENVAAFDMPMLLGLGLRKIVTATPWTDKEIEFSGPLLRDLLLAVGAKGEKIQAIALNGYSVDIPVQDAADYDVIVACYMDGKTFGLRERGPLWVIYPWAEFKKLQDVKYYSRSVWQLSELVIP